MDGDGWFTWLCTEEVCVRVCAGWRESCILLLWLRSFSILGAPVHPSVFIISCINASRLSLSERVFPLDSPWELLPDLLYYCKPRTVTGQWVSVQVGERKLQWKNWIHFLANPPTSWSDLVFSKQVFVRRHSKLICHGFPLWNQHKAVTSTGCALTSPAHSACSCHLT